MRGRSLLGRALVFSGLLWSAIAVLLALSTVSAELKLGHTVSVWREVAQSLLVFLPLCAIGVLDFLWIERDPDVGLRPRSLLILVLLHALLVLPLFLAWEALLPSLTRGLPLAGFLDRWLGITPLFIWVDFMVVQGGLAAQLVYSALRSAQQRALALERARTRIAELNLQRLQGQLEPHFLFNALNSISALVRNAERAPATAALARLSELLRHALRASQQAWISVADELAFLHDYLELQQLRFGERLTVQWQIASESWASLACPPLLLQPLVENAVRHGLEAGRGDCTVVIAVALEEPQVVFRIRNPAPVAAAPAPAGHGIGLRSIRERLQLLYGDAARLSTRRPDETAFVAELTLPARELA